jgi:threonine synthase
VKYYSTNNKSHFVTLEEAVIRGLAPDGGLYMPENIKPMSKDFFDTLDKKSFPEIAFEVANHLLGDDVPANELKKMIDHTITFDAPLVQLEENIFALELFHGPTLAFKDFGAKFMSQLLSYFARKENREVTVLVATSGDTGSAVANGFLDVAGTNVVVLYPAGKVSEIQEKQFTTLGQNISSLAIDGTFDDCQKLVKLAFMDKELQSKLFLTSANSINIARLIPQSFYYFYAWSKFTSKDKVVFSVPSGNFGNLTAGLMAKKLGLPIQHFVAATNANDIVPEYLETKEFLPRVSVSTISNAMDVGNPSNFARILDLFENDWVQIKKEITGYMFSDDETRKMMRSVFQTQGYILDPHGAVGLLGLKKYLDSNKKSVGVFLETAHPAKFKSVVDEVIQSQVTLPARLQAFMMREKMSVAMEPDYSSLKNFLLKSSGA